MQTATSLQVYKHLLETREKMISRYKDKRNHPFYMKKHSEQTKKKLISKANELNPMYGKKHKIETKKLMSLSKNSFPNGVNVYNNTGLFIGQFKSKTEIATALNISKSTVSRHIKNGKLYLNFT